MLEANEVINVVVIAGRAVVEEPVNLESQVCPQNEGAACMSWEVVSQKESESLQSRTRTGGKQTPPDATSKREIVGASASDTRRIMTLVVQVQEELGSLSRYQE